MSVFIEAVRGLFNRADRSQEIRDNKFSSAQAQEIAWHVYYQQGRSIYFTDVQGAVMGNENIPSDIMRKATIEEIREQRGATTGKSADQLAVLGRQFLADHLGPEETERISGVLAKRAEEVAVVDKKE